MHSNSLASFLSLIVAFVVSSCHTVPDEGSARPIRIGIIGTGIGGATSVHFLTKLSSHYPLVVDIYEKNDKIGGRVDNITLDGHIIESGASIAIQENKYIWDLTHEMGLTPIIHEEHAETSSQFSIWDGVGKEFPFYKKYSSKILTLLQLFWHFGILSFYRAVSLAQSFIDACDKMYTFQDDGKFVTNATSFWNIMDAYQATQEPCAPYLYQKLSFVLCFLFLCLFFFF